MKLTDFSKISESEKEYEIKDFADFTETCTGVFPENNGLSGGFKFMPVGYSLPGGVRATAIYTVNGNPVFYCTDGRVYVKDKNGLSPVKIKPISKVPKIFSVLCDGKKSLVITAEYGAYVINDTFNFVGINKADEYAVFNGVLFSGKGRKITVCKDADYTGYNTEIYGDKFILLDAGLGSVKKLIPTKECLYAVCLRGIVKIESSVDDIGYKLSNESVFSVKSIDDTVTKVGENIYFTSNEGLTEFDGNGIKTIPSFLDGKNYSVIGKAVSCEGLYLLPVSISNEYRIFVFDAVKRTQCFLPFGGLLLSDGGFAVGTDGTVKKLSDGIYNSATWESKETDFNRSKIKSISGIYSRVNKPCKMQVYSDGDFSREFDLKDAEEIRTCIRGRNFKFKVIGDNGIELTALKIKYRV